MLFHTYTFATFFLLVALAHAAAPRRARRYVLLLGSYVFLGWWSVHTTLLLLLTTIIDYVAAGAIFASSSARTRRLYLAASMSANLGILGLFKYYNFFARSLHEYLSLRLPLHELLLPIGISFYTFESMSYTIDVYRRRTGLARDFVDFALFVAFFPRLIAGPIMRAAYFLPQLASERPRNVDDVRAGLKLFFVGLFKKVVVADNLATFVDAVHRAPVEASTGDLWVSAYAFAIQIYCDFSGYSEMAIGLARLLGYDLLPNFDRPYLARNVVEFWRRWHISLSTWLRDYLYVSLGGNRLGTARTLSNLMITMVLGGLWHGANWTFIAWGFLHGALLIVHRLVRAGCDRSPRLRAAMDRRTLAPVWVLLTLHCWTLSMVLFRASTIRVAASMLARMLAFAGDLGTRGSGSLWLCLAFYAAQVAQERHDVVVHFDRLPIAVRTALMVAGCYALVLFAAREVVPFLYFQF